MLVARGATMIAIAFILNALAAYAAFHEGVWMLGVFYLVAMVGMVGILAACPSIKEGD